MAVVVRQNTKKLSTKKIHSTIDGANVRFCFQKKKIYSKFTKSVQFHQHIWTLYVHQVPWPGQVNEDLHHHLHDYQDKQTENNENHFELINNRQ